MKENNLQKKPRDAREYANLFLLDENGKKRDFSNTKSVCFVTIGYVETLWILLQEFAGKDITIIDRKSEIDFIEAWIKLHKRNDIRVKRIEVETDEAVHSTILKLNMNMFDLIIANPPYGKSSSLSKKIINTLLENKVAKEMVILAPPRSFLDTLDKIVEFENKGLTSDLFDIPAGNGIRVYCTKYTNDKVNKYSEFDLRFYDKKLKQLAEAIHSYNKKHETFVDTDYEYGDLSWKTLNYLSAEIKKGLDPNRIFLIPYFTPKNGVRWGECGDHNNGIKLWDFEKCRSSALAIVLKEGYKKYFNEYFYRYYKNEERRVNGLLNQFLMCIRLGWSDSPGVEAYLEYLPHVDWSHPWTDQEILKEIGLPEDFLEKEEC